MEQARDWMLMRRRQLLKSHFQVSMKSLRESWEEKAFAEDAGGSLEGCIWPPTSYTCSFCRREFRSAQALGGHMNVHRRERAKLKQTHSPNNDNPNPLKSSDLKFPHRPDGFDHTFSASRVSALSATYSIAGGAGEHEGQLFRSDSATKTTLTVSSCYDEAINYKGRKIDVSALPFLVVGVKPAVAGSMLEDLDLELRL